MPAKLAIQTPVSSSTDGHERNGGIARTRSAGSQNVGRLPACIPLLIGAVMGLAASGCRDRGSALEVVVTERDTLPGISRIVVTVRTGERSTSATLGTVTGPPLTLPATVRLSASNLPSGDAIVEATAFDIYQAMIARGASNARIPSLNPVAVELVCESLACSRKGPDGGTDGAFDAGDGAGSDAAEDVTTSPKCGNGRIDPDETCDTARTPGFPGACPDSCDDGIACTHDQTVGERCTVSCEHVEVIAAVKGDGCCPAAAEHGTDSDCSPSCGNAIVDPGESCDQAIVTGLGSCPDSPSCDDQDPCTADSLISAGTCSARCAHVPISLSVPGDRCCPVGRDATTDADCPPSCGNAILEAGEECDVGISVGAGRCPTLASCDDDLACTRDALTGLGCHAVCVHETIVSPAAGDGCCPTASLSPNVDPDCPAICGNGILEAGESCDRTIAGNAFGACPSACPLGAPICARYVVQGSTADCSAACVVMAVAECSTVIDGCCPTGCSSPADPDCSPRCGDGQVDSAETCDTAIPAGTGACPRTCADGISCTTDLLVDAGSCNARCVFIQTSALRSGDGCCPPGAHAGIDTDCRSSCGNGVVETPWETCDTASTPASCSSACPPAEVCATSTRMAATECDVRCTRSPITTCVPGDGCCAPGCNTLTDSDCGPRCGNSVVEPFETCDRAITAGHIGACSASCVDSDPCTLDFARGTPESCTRACSHVPITACGGGDRCCPAGCNGQTDSDCTPACGDGEVQAGETCDPASTCPTVCPSDGDPCTIDQLVGVAALCTAACAHIPVLRCSGMQRDGCCPTTECNATNDSDC